jgi:hypothetical protein
MDKFPSPRPSPHAMYRQLESSMGRGGGRLRQGLGYAAAVGQCAQVRIRWRLRMARKRTVASSGG